MCLICFIFKILGENKSISSDVLDLQEGWEVYKRISKHHQCDPRKGGRSYLKRLWLRADLSRTALEDTAPCPVRWLHLHTSALSLTITGVDPPHPGHGHSLQILPHKSLQK
jgi:hypothetical protein